MGRDEARALHLKRYFTGEFCEHGHRAKRYVSNGYCVECVRLRCVEENRPKPRKLVSTDYSHLTDAQVDAWYARVGAVRPNARRYKHRPLEERPVIYRPPVRTSQHA
jgi:hypothetical protein